MIKLTKKQAVTYKRQWQQVESMHIQELRRTSMSLKFKQLCFLINSFHFRPIDKRREKEVKAVRWHWMILKKRWKNGDY